MVISYYQNEFKGLIINIHEENNFFLYILSVLYKQRIDEIMRQYHDFKIWS